MHTITQEEITDTAKGQDITNIYQQTPGEDVWKEILRELNQVEQNIALGWVNFFAVGALTKESGNVLTHADGSGSNGLHGKLTETMACHNEVEMPELPSSCGIKNPKA